MDLWHNSSSRRSTHREASGVSISSRTAAPTTTLVTMSVVSSCPDLDAESGALVAYVDRKCRRTDSNRSSFHAPNDRGRKAMREQHHSGGARGGGRDSDRPRRSMSEQHVTTLRDPRRGGGKDNGSRMLSSGLAKKVGYAHDHPNPKPNSPS